MIQVTHNIFIDEKEIEETFIRSSGPGGQKVNKTSSAVQLRFNAQASISISETVLQRLKAVSGRLMTRTGIIIITANRFRTQEQNRKDALDRLIMLVRRAAIIPRDRKPTRLSRSKKKRRIDDKRRKGELKKNRVKLGSDDPNI